MTFTLIDDETIDTVVRCDNCGQEIRFDSASLCDSHSHDPADDCGDEQRVKTAFEEAEFGHECED